jgi:hypothetical protein
VDQANLAVNLFRKDLKFLSAKIEIRWDYELCMGQVPGMGLKPFVIISFNPLAEARGNR